MLRFFRSIRQRLLRQGKFRKYTYYALGEIALVVIGILIALQINNWNEQRKTLKVKEKLILSLIDDFEINKEQLGAKISEMEERIARTKRFLELAPGDNDHISVDSLKHYGLAAFNTARFEPILISYNQAISNGSIELLKNKDLLLYIGDFMFNLKYHENQTRQGGDIFYKGGFWELRKELGNIRNLGLVKRDFAFKLSDEEYRAFIAKPIVFATYDNMNTQFGNIRLAYIGMEEAADNILNTLHEIAN